MRSSPDAADQISQRVFDNAAAVARPLFRGCEGVVLWGFPTLMVPDFTSLSGEKAQATSYRPKGSHKQFVKVLRLLTGIKR